MRRGAPMHIDHRHAFNRSKVEHDLVDGRVDPYAGANDRVVKAIWHILQKHYPGHPWAVAANHQQGVAQIFMPTFTNWQYIINLKDYYSDPKGHHIIKGAGEMLERYRLPRSGFDVGHYMAAQKKHLPFLNMKRRPPD